MQHTAFLSFMNSNETSAGLTCASHGLDTHLHSCGSKVMPMETWGTLKRDKRKTDKEAVPCQKTKKRQHSGDEGRRNIHEQIITVSFQGEVQEKPESR